MRLALAGSFTTQHRCDGSYSPNVNPAMSPISRSAQRTALHPRLTLLVVGAAITGLIAILQWTAMAPLPHALDDFLGGLAVGLAASGTIGWAMSRD